jgi:hypothetical protein
MAGTAVEMVVTDKIFWLFSLHIKHKHAVPTERCKARVDEGVGG